MGNVISLLENLTNSEEANATRDIDAMSWDIDTLIASANSKEEGSDDDDEGDEGDGIGDTDGEADVGDRFALGLGMTNCSFSSTSADLNTFESMH
jgi:hypothetical protein